jgi:hypothetical protein
MGRFEKGKPRHPNAGIKKGTVHNKTRVELACERAANGRGVDPFLVMAEIAADPSHPDRLVAAKALGKYLEPEKKAVEVSGQDGEPIALKIVIEDYSKE